MDRNIDLDFEDPIVVFDGMCNLCSGVVRFILDHEENSRLKFASLDSETGEKIMKDHNLDPDNPDSFVLYSEGVIYEKSEAALRVMKYLEAPLPLLSKIIRVIPKFLRNLIYEIISESRYKIFGKKDKCMKPPSSYSERFLD